MAKTLLLNIDIVQELPSLRHIKYFRTMLWKVTKTLAAYQLGNAADWKQLHTDETSHHQTALINVVKSFLTLDNKLKTICLNGAIMAEDGTIESQCHAIIESFHDCAKLLQCWQSETSTMFPNMSHLLGQLPNPNKINISCMIGCGMSHDICDTEHSTKSFHWQKRNDQWRRLFHLPK